MKRWMTKSLPNLFVKSISKRWSCYQPHLLYKRVQFKHLVHVILVFDGDQEIFDCILKPILDNIPKYNVEGP